MLENETSRRIIFGTRSSALARWQTQWVIARLQAANPSLVCETRLFTTTGDRNLDTPLAAFGGKGVFTSELEDALLTRTIDAAVHSLKDLPVEDAPDLMLGAICEREDARDALVSRDGYTLMTLPWGARVGTCSHRRTAQMLAARPDLTIASVRGNVDTRIRKAMNGDYDAIVLAVAGLRRLELEHYISAYLPFDVMLPAPGQAALAVQCRVTDHEMQSVLRTIDHAATRVAVTAERTFLLAMGGGCSAPVAAYAIAGKTGLHLTGLVASLDGRQVVRVSGEGDDPTLLATDLAGQAFNQWGAGVTVDMKLPLADKRIVVTRPQAQAEMFIRRLASLGAVPIAFPTIEIAPPTDFSALDDALRNIAQYDWLIFTSVNGVEAFWQRAAQLGILPGIDAFARIATIGPATASALKGYGHLPTLVPKHYVAEAIADEIGDVVGKRVLLPRAEVVRDALAVELKRRGAIVTEAVAYRTLAAKPEPAALEVLAQGVDVVTFTSSSTVRNFLELITQAHITLNDPVIACIGPVTVQTARDAGLTVSVMAETYTTDGLIDALINYYTL